jgi:hypothetical protein
MIFSERNDLPKALVNVLTRDIKPRSAKYSVTELIGPPQIRCLRERHGDKIEIDPVDRIWLLFGKLLHGKLESASDGNALTEERLVITVDGITVSGTPDLYDGDTIWDYKTTSVFAIKEIKPEWVTQANLYRYILAKSSGFQTASLKIVAICKDWRRGESKKKADYPQSPVVILEIAVWSEQECLDYLQQRIALHESANTLPDDQLPLCSSEERWERPAKWAVTVEGAARAMRVMDTEDEAKKYLAEHPKKGALVEFRKGSCVRCEDYCEVSGFCNQQEKEGGK